jgi:hypothetical protein
VDVVQLDQRASPLEAAGLDCSRVQKVCKRACDGTVMRAAAATGRITTGRSGISATYSRQAGSRRRGGASLMCDENPQCGLIGKSMGLDPIWTD